MKKILAVAALFALVFVSFVSPAAGEQFNGFSIDFPPDFSGAYTTVDSETQSDFFTENLTYETESDYELMRVMIGESATLNTLFAEDFGFANRQDLDLSLLTEQQLTNEAEELTAYIDKSFPLYMTYVSPKSMVVDDRLGLVVTGYYTDYQGGLTGEFRAYEFYYMGQVIIVYYDTQIEGTYFVESVFDLPDSIVATLDFELNPSAQPMNAAMYKEMVDTAAPVGGFLAAAVLLGVLFGFAFKKRSPEDTGSAPNLAFDPSPPEKKSKPVKEKKKASSKSEKNEKKSAAEPPVLAPSQTDEAEAVDWTSMLSDLKKDTAETLSARDETQPSESDQSAAASQTETTADKKNADKTEKTEQMTTGAESTPKKARSDETKNSQSPSAEEPSETDPMQAQLQAMDDMTAEISATLGSLNAITNPPKPAAETLLDPKTSAPENNVKIHFESAEPDAALSESKNAEAVSENYQSYMDNLLPTRKKQKKAQKEATSEKTAPSPESGNTGQNAASKANSDFREMLRSSEKEPIESLDSSPEEKKKKQGILSRMLSSVADRIERDGEETTEPEFDSRMEMHISEKTERHPVDKLMPGLFDDAPEEEPVEILLDQSEDMKFERSKKKSRKPDLDREKQIKNRVDNLSND